MSVRITPTLDGPNMVSGDVEIIWPSGHRIDTRDEADKAGAIYLCRCGRSQTKPFCDGTHEKVGFRSREGDETAHHG
jgi:CDGSH-type Zn-finger protein